MAGVQPRVAEDAQSSLSVPSPQGRCTAETNLRPASVRRKVGVRSTPPQFFPTGDERRHSTCKKSSCHSRPNSEACPAMQARSASFRR